MIWQSLTFVVEFVICLVFGIFVYSRLGSFTQRPWYVSFLTLLAWVLCFYIVFLVPNDVAQAAQCSGSACNQTEVANTECEPIIIVPTNILKILWSIVYWMTLFLTWGVFPIMQTFSMTGEFTFGDKMRTSIKSNLLLYSIMGAVLAVVGVFAIIELQIHWSLIPATVTAAANAYGLFLLIAMLGHGLVNVPRRLWQRSNREMNLKRFQFDVARFSANLFDSKESLKKTLKKVRKASEITAETDSYRKYIDVIISKCPPEEYTAVPYGEGNIELSYNKLALLHEKLMREDHSVKMYRSLYDHSIREGLRSEDILRSKQSSQWKINWTFKQARTHFLAKIFDVIEYVWLCYLEAWFYRLLCVITAGLSCVIVWSELLFSACGYLNIDVSVFSLVIRSLTTSAMPPILLQVIIFLPVVYIAWCAYSSLFQLRLFNYYHIVAHHMSDSNSLLFSAAYLCRLTAPLAYNFMQMSHFLNTTFVDVMGNLDIAVDTEDESASGTSTSVVWLGQFFQTFFPVLLLPFILMTLFNVYSRIMGLLRIKRFQFTEDFSDDSIEDGREILEEERDRLSRGVRGEDAQDEREASASRRSTNSRGVQFTQSDKNELDEDDEIEAENPPGTSISEIVGISKSLKSSFTRIFTKDESKNEDIIDEVAAREKQSKAASRRYSRDTETNSLPSFDDKKPSNDLWSDFE